MKSDKGQTISLSDFHYLEIADEVSLPGECQASFGDIAADFDRMFDDFDELIRLEGETLWRILSPRGASTILDCACGTGMQAIALARLGYAVSASDISTKCLAVVRENAAKQGLTIRTKRADFRTLHPWRGTQFDAIVAMGNSLPMLPKSEGVDQAFRSMRRLLRPGAPVIVSVRDYSVLRDAQQTQTPRVFRMRNGNPEWVMDLRLFGTGNVRVVTLVVTSIAGRWRLKSFVKSYLYLSAEDVRKKMEAAGFSGVKLLDLSASKPYTGGEWFLAVGEK